MIGEAFDVLVDIMSMILMVSLYCIPAGIVYARTRLYFLRNTDVTSDDARVVATLAGVGWPIAVPWFVMARVLGSVDAQTVAEKNALLRETRLEAEERESKARARVEEAKAREDMAIRQRLRMAGQDVPYTVEERLAIEKEENMVNRDRLAIEQKQQEARRYR